MTDSDITLRGATAGDYDRLADSFAASMMFNRRPRQVASETFEPDRALLAEDAESTVGTAVSFTRTMSVPGNVVAAAHVTKVGVAATHRRRGILSALMRRQLSEIPEGFAALWASEIGIYERFGYAAASWNVELNVDLAHARPHRAVGGGLREIPVEQAATSLPEALTAYQRVRPGVSGRNLAQWAAHLDDPQDERNGATALRVLAHETAGVIDGYALWRGKLDFADTGADGTIQLHELVAPQPDAYRALWSHLLTMDLATRLHCGHVAIDEPMRRLVANPRALRPTLRDGLWVRVVDVPRALTQRRYASPIDIVLEVHDDFLPGTAGRFHLTGDRTRAHCRPSDAPPDLSLSITALGAVYLGGRSLRDVAFDGPVTEHRDGMLDAASVAFGWPTAPVSIEIF